MQRRKEHRLVYDMISQSDLVIEVVDCRFPLKTRSRRINAIIKKTKKKNLICINKIDLVPYSIAMEWKNYFNKKIAPAVVVSTRARQGTGILRRQISALLSSGGRVCVVGLPNTGKSSLINVLAGRHSARTSSKSGFTRSKQYIKLSPEIMLVDTPGVAPFDAISIFELAYTGCINPEQIDIPDEIAVELIELVRQKFSEELSNYGSVEISDLTSYEYLNKLALAKKRILAGGVPNLEQMGRIFIRDFTKGKVIYYEESSDLTS